MKINKKHLLYIILILTSSCKNKTTYESNLVNKIDTTFICDLNENIEIINQIDDAKLYIRSSLSH
ncbi:hypothetical protein SDC9_87760 [bioreactor metagenome]|uniref:Uncharacterized protein n=1 Tax=bioreactor metagenome TaxID=1076179 RepID=A0A644ZJQ4_9ZZZZ